MTTILSFPQSFLRCFMFVLLNVKKIGARTTTDINIISMFHNFFSSLASSWYLSRFSPSFIFILLSSGTTKFTGWEYTFLWLKKKMFVYRQSSLKQKKNLSLSFQCLITFSLKNSWVQGGIIILLFFFRFKITGKQSKKNTSPKWMKERLWKKGKSW